ncbi:HAD family hydrolase [Streptomyces sp. NPDC048361]|uniref:HAD family hydrolase n=1 Tax=Streptomyces sp. NPDC048361 TaxID=3154720 RepID=UPI003419FC9D
MTIRAVVFDVGECLVDETREYGTWADWLGVPHHTFAAMFGAVIAQGRDYREVFQEFRPGFDLYEQRQARADAGRPEHFDESDLYADVRPALAQLRADGLWLGIAGNQTVRAGGIHWAGSSTTFPSAPTRAGSTPPSCNGPSRPSRAPATALTPSCGAPPTTSSSQWRRSAGTPTTVARSSSSPSRRVDP